MVNINKRSIWNCDLFNDREECIEVSYPTFNSMDYGDCPHAIVKPWSNDPIFTPNQWQLEVSMGETRRGCADWARSKREQRRDEIERMSNEDKS